MASYTRQSTFSDGDLITAALFNDEYNQLVAAFDNATGHRHDGTVGEGPVISVLGDAGLATPLNKILIDTTNDHIEFWVDVSGTSTQQLYIADGAIVPTTNNDVDLGTSASKFKDLYLSGTANITGNAVVTGNLTVEGTTVTLNTATLDVEDKNITLNYGTGDTSSNADGAGITIQDAVDASTDATILWNAANDRFDFSHAIDVTGTITSDGLTVEGDATIKGGSDVSNTGATLQLESTETQAVGSGASISFKGDDGSGTQRVFGVIKGSKTSATSGQFNGGLDFFTRVTAEGNARKRLAIASNGDISFYEVTGTTAKLFWDSSTERLGLGTSSPSHKLTVEGTTSHTTARVKTTTGNANLRVSTNNSDFAIIGQGSSNRLDIYDNNASSTRLSLDSSGNFLIGTTTNAGSGGVSIGQNATIYARRTGGEIITLRRDSTDGALINFQKDGTAVGSIGANAGVMTLASPNGNKHYVANSALFPSANNILDLGTSSQAYKDLHLAGTVNFGSLSDGTITITGFVDEDNMASNSATLLPTQQSVKAYVDSQISSAGGNGISFEDNEKAQFGNGNDLQIYHDGGNSRILDNGEGFLAIGTNGSDIRLTGNSFNEYMAKFVQDGAVELYHNNNERFKTVTDGLLLTTAGGNLSTSATSTSGLVKIKNTDATTGMNNYKSGIAFTTGNTNNTRSVIAAKQTDTSANRQGLAFLVHPDTSAGTMREALQIAHNSDIAFYDDTGTSKNMVWDASEDSLEFVDNAKIKLGAGGDLSMYHDGANTSFNNFTGDLLLRQFTDDKDVLIQSDAGDGTITTYFRADGSTGETKLYNYGTLKLTTANDGIDVSGVASTTFGVNLIDPTATAYGGHFSYDDGQSKVRIGGVTNGTKNAAITIVRDTSHVTIASSLDVTGNIGIGTSSPAAKLDVRAANGNEKSLNIGRSDTGSYFEVNHAGNDLRIYNTDGTGQDILFGVDAAGTDQLNKVGIGTASPSSPLTVESAFDYVANFRSTDTTAGILLTDANAQCRVTNTNGNLCLSADINNEEANSAIRFLLDTSTNSGTDATMVLRSTGLGIGTASPAQLLHLSSSNPTIQFTDTDTGADSYIRANTTTGALKIEADENNEVANSAIQFDIDGSEKARIDSSGNVGIGTSSPQKALNVFADGTAPVRFERNTSHGQVIQIYKDGSAISSIGTNSTGIGTSVPHSTARLHIQGNDGASGSTPNVAANELFVDNAGDTGVTVGTTNTGTGYYAFADSDVALRAGIFYDHSTDDMGFRAASGTAMTIDSNRRLGVGTTSPTHKLHVYHATTDTVANFESGDASVAVNFTASDNSMQISTSGTDGIIKNNGAGNFRLFNNGSERARIDSNGKLGVNTTSLDGIVTIKQSSNSDVNGLDGIRLNASTGTTYSGFGLVDATGTLAITAGDAGGTNNTAITFRTATSGSEAEKARINSNGNLGLGTASPAAKLHVKLGGIADDSISLVESSGSSTYGVYIKSAYAEEMGRVGALSQADGGLDGASIAFRDYGRDIVFNTHEGASNSEKVRIKKDGKVGIGISSPLYPLDVQSASNIQLRVASTTSSNNARVTYAPNNTNTFSAGVDASSSAFTFYDIVNNASPVVIEQGAGANILRVTSDSRVGIGTSTPQERLHVNGNINISSANPELIINDNTGTATPLIRFRESGVTAATIKTTSQNLIFAAGGGTEKARIDTSGNLLVGTTNDFPPGDTGNEGVAIKPDNIAISRQGSTPLFLDRMSSDGIILDLRKDNSTIGRLRSYASDLIIQTGVTGLRFNDGDNAIHPVVSAGSVSDNLTDLGLSNARFKDLHLGGKAYVAAMNVDAAANDGIKISSTSPYLFFNDTDTANTYDSSISQSGATLNIGGATPAQTIKFRNKASFGESARFNTIGHFGIGNTSPQEKLTIGGANSQGDIGFHIGGHRLISFGYMPSNSSGVTYPGYPTEIRHDPTAGTLRLGIDGTSRSVGDTASITNVLAITKDHRVGIGTLSPVNKLDVRNGNIMVGGYGSGNDYGLVFTPADSETYWHIYNDAGGHLAFGRSSTVGNTERMRIDSSGNVITGKTSVDFGTAGSVSYATGLLTATVDGNACVQLNRLTSDGVIQTFSKDSGTVGRISTTSTGIALGTPLGSGSGIHLVSNAILPSTSTGGTADNLHDLGSTSSRFKDLHLGGIAYTNNIRAAGGSDLQLQTDEGVARIQILDSDGSVGIGTTSPATHLHILGPKDSASNPVVRIQHSLATHTDGALVDFQNNAQTIRGTIGTRQSETNTNLYITGGNTGLKFLSYITYKAIYPVGSDGDTEDDLIDLGASSARFDDIYATNGTIQTSDRNEKQDIQALTDAEQRVATACKGLIRRYKFNKAVTEKGDDARYHFGIIAQDLQDAFTAEGLDAGDYGMFISSTWTDDDGVEQTRLGVRYNELLAFIIATL